MARILPDPLLGTFPPEVLRVQRALKAIPGDEFIIWVGLPLPGTDARPDFLVVHADSTAFVITVSRLTDSDIEKHLHGGLFANSPAPQTLAAAEREKVRAFIHRALGSPAAAAEEGPPAVYGLVLFPNAAHATLEQLWADNPHDGCYWLGERHLSAEKLAACLRKLATGGLAERQLQRLRSHFSPETVVPPRFSAKLHPHRNVAAELAPLLLDYDQEAWAKNRLHLPSETLALAEAPSTYGESALVTGVAGSGKSLVLLFRACTQAKLHPGSRSLVLTHNKALRRELEVRFGELGRPQNVHWHTYFSWVQSVLNEPIHTCRVVQYAERDALVAEAMRREGRAVTGQNVEFLRDEFDWMQDRGIPALADYLAAERVGRGLGLSAEQRAGVHAIYRCYRELLTAAHAEDWSGRALRCWEKLARVELTPEPYDYIYVDEAQFFAPVWLRSLRRALRPAGGRLFLAADPTQGFLKRRQSWVACGIDLRGRSTRLRHSYRNTREILAFAADFYRARLGDEEEPDINLPDATELLSAEPGEAPRLISLSSRQDETARVINELRDYLDRGGDPEAVLVLVASGLRTGPVHDELAHAIGANRVVDARKTTQRGSVRVCSIDGATGLEAPIVFLLGAAELLEKEDDLQSSADQRAELRRDNTRRLYMGFTRAGMKLVITWVGPLPEMLSRPPRA
jgi:hypothetical protein